MLYKQIIKNMNQIEWMGPGRGELHRERQMVFQ